MEKSAKKEARDITPAFNRFGYTAFVLLSLYFFLVSGDPGAGVSNLGIALVFDPFDPKMAWAQRPRWQKAWLIIHLVALLGALGYLIFR